MRILSQEFISVCIGFSFDGIGQWTVTVLSRLSLRRSQKITQIPRMESNKFLKLATQFLRASIKACFVILDPNCLFFYYYFHVSSSFPESSKNLSLQFKTPKFCSNTYDLMILQKVNDLSCLVFIPGDL